MGRAQRIMLKSSVGIQAFGDLVYPADYSAGQRYPLIVAQYESRGLLRGGTGDEFPIQAFASNGCAVLSMQSTAPVGDRSRPQDCVEVGRPNLKGMAHQPEEQEVAERGGGV